LSKYSGRPLRLRDLLLVFFPGTIAVFAPLIYGLWIANNAYIQFGPAAAESWSRPWFLLATFALGPLTLLAFYRLYISRRSITVYENGLHLRLSPFYSQTLRWEQINGIAAGTIQERFLGIALRNHPRATLLHNLGKPYKLDNQVENLPALTEEIKAHLFPRLHVLLRSAFLEGKRLEFGPIAIHTQGLRLRSKDIPWEQITHLGVHSGYLVVESSGKKRWRMAVTKIPNLELLTQIITWGTSNLPQR
jgi:hypothetical protein